MDISSYVIPVVISAILLHGAVGGIDVFECFLEGAAGGIKTSIGILPALVALTTSVGMLRASGALDILCHALSPLAGLLHIPTEVLPLVLLRPLSGSSALVFFENLLTAHGPDSTAGLTASVIMGASETVFYTVAVYYGSVNITKTRHTLPAALAGALSAFVLSALAVRLLF